MARSRKGIGGPKTPEGKARALANLVPFAHKHDLHGVGAVSLDQPDTQAMAQHIVEVLNADAQVIKPPDEVAVNVLACILRRLQQADQYLSRNGLVNPKGQLRPVAALVPSLAKQALEYLDALGATPQARARLGLTTGKAFDLAQALASLDDEEGSGAQ